MPPSFLNLTRFSRNGLDSLFDASGCEEILGWGSYYHERLETSVGAELGEAVVKRVRDDGLDYALFSDDERTALDVVLASIFSIDHRDTLWRALDARVLGDVPGGAVERLLACAEAAGDEGLLRLLVEGRRLTVDEPPDGSSYAMLAPEESEAIAAHVRRLLAADALAAENKTANDLEAKLLPVLDEVVADDEWLYVDGQEHDCVRRDLRKAAKRIPPGSLQAADEVLLVKRRPKAALQILEALLPKVSGIETKKVLDRLVTAARLAGLEPERATWERRRADFLAKAGS